MHLRTEEQLINRKQIHSNPIFHGTDAPRAGNHRSRESERSQECTEMRARSMGGCNIPSSMACSAPSNSFQTDIDSVGGIQRKSNKFYQRFWED